MPIIVAIALYGSIFGGYVSVESGSAKPLIDSIRAEVAPTQEQMREETQEDINLMIGRNK